MYMLGSTGVHMKRWCAVNEGDTLCSQHFKYGSNSCDIWYTKTSCWGGSSLRWRSIWQSRYRDGSNTEILYSLLYIFIPRAGLPAILTWYHCMVWQKGFSFWTHYIIWGLVTSHACRSICDQDQIYWAAKIVLGLKLLSGSNHKMIATLFYYLM